MERRGGNMFILLYFGILKPVEFERKCAVHVAW